MIVEPDFGCYSRQFAGDRSRIEQAIRQKLPKPEGSLI
jgi:hypothetical protein